MTKRIHMFNPKFGRFNTPASYYGQVLRNNRDRNAYGNKRILKKAQDILNDLNKDDGGWDIMQKSMRDELTYDEWLKHIRAKVSKRNVGNNKRWYHRYSLRTAFRIYNETNKMSNYEHDYD